MITRFKRWPTVGAAIFFIGGLTSIGFLTRASGGGEPGVTQTSCDSTSPCLDIHNSGAGHAVQAAAKSASGIVGVTRATSSSQAPGAIFSGVRGEDLSPQLGSNINFSSGVFGRSVTGFGTAGFSQIHAGAVGLTKNPSLTDNYGSAGVEGFDDSTDAGTKENLNAGVEGGTVGGSGVFGFSTYGNGVRGITTNPSSQNGNHRAAVFGIDESNDGGGLDFGVAGFSPGTAIAGISIAPPPSPGSPMAPAVAAVCENGGTAIEAATGFSRLSSILLTLDCAGNLNVKGTVTSGSSLLIASKASGGEDVATYAARQTQSTIEDFGEGRVVDGQTHVRISPDFAKTIDPARSYLVFITPEGDSRGLYVENKSVAGFDVHESQGGRSTLAFAYRIVARPLGSDDGRLPTMRAVLARQASSVRGRGITVADALSGLAPRVPASPPTIRPH